MKNLDEQLQIVDELIRKVTKNLSPFDENDLSWLQKKDVRDRLHGDHPKCFLTMKSNYGDPLPMFAICNRMGVQDPKVIALSMKLAKRLQDDGKFDGNELEGIHSKLKNLHSRYSKDIPKPPVEAGRKGQQTKRFNDVSQYLNKIR